MAAAVQRRSEKEKRKVFICILYIFLDYDSIWVQNYKNSAKDEYIFLRISLMFVFSTDLKNKRIYISYDVYPKVL